MGRNIYSDYITMVENSDQSLVESTSLIEMTPEEVMLENDKRPYNYATQYEQLQSLKIKADEMLGVSDAETLVRIGELESNGWQYHDDILNEIKQLMTMDMSTTGKLIPNNNYSEDEQQLTPEVANQIVEKVNNMERNHGGKLSKASLDQSSAKSF
jgi:hypothetical protein